MRSVNFITGLFLNNVPSKLLLQGEYLGKLTSAKLLCNDLSKSKIGKQI